MKNTKETVNRKTSFEDLPELLRTKEVQAFLGVAPDTLYRAIQNGEIPHRKIGHIIFIPKGALKEVFVA